MTSDQIMKAGMREMYNMMDAAGFFRTAPLALPAGYAKALAAQRAAAPLKD